jgi:hypothetical protein
MATQDDVVRAQTRALIRVLVEYQLDREWGGPTPIWRDLETFGQSGTAAELRKIGRDHGGTAAAAFCCGVKHRAPRAALYLALASFTRASPAYRFLDPSRWIALAFAFRDKKPTPGPGTQGEVLERLEAAFEAEIDASNCDRVVGQGLVGGG